MSKGLAAQHVTPARPLRPAFPETSARKGARGTSERIRREEVPGSLDGSVHLTRRLAQVESRRRPPRLGRAVRSRFHLGFDHELSTKRD